MDTIQDRVALMARRAMCSATDEEIESLEGDKVSVLSAEIFEAINEVSSQIADESFCTYTLPTEAQRKRFLKAIATPLRRAFR